MKKQLLVLITLMLIASAGCAGHYAFKVQTQKDNTIVPVEGAEVYLRCPGQGNQVGGDTDKDGIVKISMPKCDMKDGGEFTLEVYKNGCDKYERSWENFDALEPSTMNAILLVCK